MGWGAADDVAMCAESADVSADTRRRLRPAIQLQDRADRERSNQRGKFNKYLQYTCRLV